MKNISVILAGGTGKRMGTAVPKQFLKLGDSTVIEHSIRAFDSHPQIDEVAVVVHPEWRDTLESIVKEGDFSKLTKVVDGGDERYMSSLNAIMAYIDYPDTTNLLIHDAARPMVSASVIDRVVEALTTHEAVGVAVPSTDTVWEVRGDISGNFSFVTRIPERRTMWRAQTPQAFRLPLLRDAYQRAMQDINFHATDDCGVVQRYMPGVKIAVVNGEEINMKITTSADLDFIQQQCCR